MQPETQRQAVAATVQLSVAVEVTTQRDVTLGSSFQIQGTADAPVGHNVSALVQLDGEARVGQLTRGGGPLERNCGVFGIDCKRVDILFFIPVFYFYFFRYYFFLQYRSRLKYQLNFYVFKKFDQVYLKDWRH